MTVLDDADPRYWGDEQQTRLVCQAQVFAALCAVGARWAAEVARSPGGDPGYAVWCQQRAHRAAENARMMLELTR